MEPALHGDHPRLPDVALLADGDSGCSEILAGDGHHREHRAAQHLVSLRFLF